MILVEKLSSLKEETLPAKQDYLHIEWYEAHRRVLRRRTEKGQELGIRLHKNSIGLEHGAILWQDAEQVVLVNVLPCEAIVLKPITMMEMGILCYEIGNRHLPLFLQNDCLLMPYENPAFQFLQKLGYKPLRETHRLTNLLRTSVVLRSGINPTNINNMQSLLIDANTEIISKKQ